MRPIYLFMLVAAAVWSLTVLSSRPVHAAEPIVDSVNLPWCTGASQLNHISFARWFKNKNEHSKLEFNICATQRHTLSSVSRARIKVHGVDHTFDLCESRMECLRKSQTLVDSKYCIDGVVDMDFPFFSPRLDDSTAVELLVLHGHETRQGHADTLATLCGEY